MTLHTESPHHSASEPEEPTPEKREYQKTLAARRGWIATVSLFFLEMVKIGILAGVTIGLIRYFLFKPFYVKGQSMEPSFFEHEYLIVDELTYRFREPARGDVVVFRAPTDKEDFYLKRIIGLPGERVKVEDGKVIIYNADYPQGIVMEETYIDDDATPGSTGVTLPEDQYYVLGDNRDASYDSRRFGPIHRKDMVGRSVFRGWPLHRISTFNAPSYNL